MYKRLAILLGIFLFLLPMAVQAAQPEERTTKQFLNPFYRATMTNNVQYSYNLDVSPPDGISSVKSAIISFDIYLTPSVNFTIWVNGTPCNTYFFYVSTTYASAGQSRVTFDCSNRITKAGTYNVTIRPTGANTGSVSGWLDLTYMNKPETTVTVGGTEYSINETSNYTIFAQVPSINDAICEYSIFNTSRQKTMNGILTYISGSDGLYDMDFSNPNMLNPLVAGVYRIQVSCVRPIAPQSQVMHFNEYSSASFYHILENFTGTVSDLEYMSGSGTGEVCVNATFDDRWLERGQQFNRPSFVNNITNIVGYFRTSSGNTSALNLTMKFYKYNFYSNTYTLLNISSLQGQFINTTTKEYVLPNVIINTSWASEELMSVEVCCSNRGGREIRFYHNQSAVDSRFTRNIGGVNESVSFLYKGSGEIHVNSPLSVSANVTINLDDVYGNLTDIKNTQIQILGNLSSMTNYLITINDTTYQINQSQYQNYISLLAAINSVNATANQSLQYIIGINGTVYQINQTINNKFQEILDFLASINTTLNTTLEYKLDLINDTVMQINQSQFIYYTNLMNAITNMNSSIISYLIEINGTTHYINSSQFTYYTNLLAAINNTNTSQYQQYLDLLSLLNQINATTNTTLTFVASINQSLLTYYTNLYNSLISLNTTQNQHFADIMSFLASLNYTMNTTLELKLDLINDTVFNIQDTVNQINYTVSNLNFTINFSEVLAAISQVNTTVNQNQQYLIAINDTLINDIFVILKDINYTTNTTLELKLDFINITTWDTWILLQNLTLGNVSVSANVNWTQGYVETTLLSFSDEINGEAIQLQTETLTCLSNTTLQHTINGTKWINSVWYPFNETTVEICQFGCANNICLPQPTIAFSLAIAVALMITGLIWFVWRATK